MAMINVEKYYSIIEEHYPAVKLCSEIWTSFHGILMGKDPDQPDGFLDKYEVSPITPFINGKKRYRSRQSCDIFSSQFRLR